MDDALGSGPQFSLKTLRQLGFFPTHCSDPCSRLGKQTRRHEDLTFESASQREEFGCEIPVDLPPMVSRIGSSLVPDPSFTTFGPGPVATNQESTIFRRPVSWFPGIIALYGDIPEFVLMPGKNITELNERYDHHVPME